MPLRKDIHKVMVLGSGPIVIGQAAEFDYAGTQACRALKQEGLEVVLINSNPATIMTDKAMADKIYIEPLTLETVKRVIETPWASGWNCTVCASQSRYRTPSQVLSLALICVSTATLGSRLSATTA